MTFDDSNSLITDKLTGRTISHALRNGKVLELHTNDGHCIQLQSDINGDIHFKGLSVSVALTPVEIFGTGGGL